jgi:hypothetical protein
MIPKLPANISDLIDGSYSELIKEHGFVNVAEMRLHQLVQAGAPSAPPPLEHRFTPGLYSRTIFMPAGDILVSELHLTEHQFVVSKGACSVFDEVNGLVTIAAPYLGITMPGTRRMIVVHEDTIWTTFHPNPKGWTTPEEVKDAIIGPNTNPLLKPL